LHGCAETTIDGNVFQLRADESVIIPPYAVREPRSRSKQLGYMIVNFEPKRLNVERALKRVLRCADELRADLHALCNESRRAGSDSDELIPLLFGRVLIGLCRDAAETLPRPRMTVSSLNASSHHELSEQVEQYMRRNLQNPLSRADVAEAVHFSPSHLARIFQATTGKTLLERLTELRLSQACALLSETTLSITRIALEVGFNSFSHFTQLFKSHIGMTPSDYRRTRAVVNRTQTPHPE
jgi:AraC-like DNA-binding protein